MSGPWNAKEAQYCGALQETEGIPCLPPELI